MNHLYMRFEKIIKKTFFTLLFLGWLWLILSYVAALVFIFPNHQSFEDIQVHCGKEVESVNYFTKDSINISAWFVNNHSDEAVIIIPGIGANRTACGSRSEIYLGKGYSVLMPDLRGTGKSGGSRVSFGWHEAKDLAASYKFLYEKGFRKISAHGISLGAATILYSLNHNIRYDFIVLESCYDNLENTFNNRVEKIPLPDFFYTLLKFFIQKNAKIEAEKLTPEIYIKNCNVPVLIMAGDSEFEVKTEETTKLYNNSPSSDKRIYFFKEGKHEDFLSRFKSEYYKVLTDFLLKVK